MAVTIRRATLEDGPALIPICHRFMATSAYARFLTFQPEALADVIVLLLSLPDDKAAAFLAIEEGQIVGMISGIGGPSASGDLWVEEQAWYVDETHRHTRLGYKLWGCLKDWARQNGYLMLKMVAPVGSPVLTFYERAGGLPLETSYVFRL